MKVVGKDTPWRARLRVLAILPLILVIGRYEYFHAFGGTVSIPFLAMFATTVFAAAIGGRILGLIAASLAVTEILHSYFIGVGPPTLTGSIASVCFGALVFFATGFFLGRLRDRLDQKINELNLHRTDLEADLRIEASEKERSLSVTAKHEARLSTALRLARIGHFEFETGSGNCVFCSPRHAAHFGLSPDEFKDQTAGISPSLNFVHPDDRHIVLKAIDQVRSGCDATFEYRTLWKNGDIRYIREIVEPEIDDTGRVIREVGTSLDLTDLRDTERKLRESQKLEAVGQLTAGVAHDFNNLLAVIMGNLELLQEAEDASEEAEMIEAALGAAARGAALTGKLLSFGRKSMLSPEALDLCVTIKELGALFRRTLPTSIDLDLPGIPCFCVASVDKTQFESAMLNLVVNARDAMPDGGKLTIDGARAELDAASIKQAGLDLEPGSYIGIWVTDSGTGMTDTVRRKALEPFFSTKGVGKGSGLGLPMVMGFAKQSGGDVEITSEPGKGTTVTLYFSASENTDIRHVTDEASANAAVGEGALILLVEDDASVRATAARQINSLGYRVIEAENARDAMGILRHRADVALVLSDIVMPGDMQGTDLLDAARELHPKIRFILMSGYHSLSANGANGHLSGVKRLTKPIRREALAQCLAEVIH